MQFVPVIHTYSEDKAVQNVWERLHQTIGAVDGIAFYKHPTLGAPSAAKGPDLVVLAEGFRPIVVKCLPYTIDEIHAVHRERWVVSGREIDSPFLELDDHAINLKHRFDRERPLRDRLPPYRVLALPLVARADWDQKVADSDLAHAPADTTIVFQDSGEVIALPSLPKSLSPTEWRFAKSVFQTAASLQPQSASLTDPSKAGKLGDAIRILEKQIALFDDEQLRAALQVVPGPQRIRGLAGTGKTVLLAMKAATIHTHFPNKKILFTFHTQSLYNHTQRLITRFFRAANDTDPDWDVIHIRHAWGGRAKPGVYYDLCQRQGAPALDFRAAKARDHETPFRPCCEDALTRHIVPEYDYVLIDEAQDLPKEFFEIVYKLTNTPHCIYFAYDELQNLTSIDVPSPAELFGHDEATGQPRVSLEGEYPGPMDKDIVLHKSYRCPQDVLMLAHAIGLGIHAPEGCVQMLANPASWESVGYSVEQSTFTPGERVTILRPPENSPNPISAIYSGLEEAVTYREFPNRESELTWIAEAIRNDIRTEGVSPESIIVIWFPGVGAKDMHSELQRTLQKMSIASTIPGLIDDTMEFAEINRVTLATPFRAKGNEAPVVYIAGFEILHSYVGEVEHRNRAFTCISRAKGWVRITGMGHRMRTVIVEIETIKKDLPRFEFTFPDLKTIRALDAAETTKRQKEVKRAFQSAQTLAALTPNALADLDPDLLKKLESAIKQARGDKGEAS